MKHPNQEIIDAFFEAYIERDMEALKKVVTEDITWTFPGQHPLSGTRVGLSNVVGFFDNMTKHMGSSNVTSQKLVTGANDGFVVESQHIKTAREDGHNIDHQVCVLWTFKDGKISEGRHFFSNQDAANAFFSHIAQ